MKIFFVIVLILTFIFVGSAVMSSDTEQKSDTKHETLKGGAIGAVAGTAIGAIAGDYGMGLAIGAVAGATTGYLRSKHKEHEKETYEKGYNDGVKNR